jgi:hypothetical protein
MPMSEQPVQEQHPIALQELTVCSWSNITQSAVTAKEREQKRKRAKEKERKRLRHRCNNNNHNYLAQVKAWGDAKQTHSMHHGGHDHTKH